MKRIPIIMLSFIMALLMRGQENPSFVGVQAGTSLPLGKYHSTELPDGGYALAGFSASAEGAWFFKPWLGIGGNAGIYFHPVNAVKLANDKLAEEPFLTALIIRSDPYSIYSLQAGLFFHVPLSEKLSFTAKALGGMMYAKTPYQLYKAEYFMVGKNWYEKTSAGDYEGSFLAGVGMRYELNDYVGFSLNSDFTYNDCEFDFLIANGDTRTDFIVISFIDVALGIVFKL